MEVARAEAELEQVAGEVLGHLLCQRGHENALVAIDTDADLPHEVVDLVVGLADDDLRVDDAGRADDLLDDRAQRVRSNSPGVAETKTMRGAIERNSSKVCGRLSSAEGRRKP